MVPAFLIVLAILAFALRREKKIVCRYLFDEITAGRLTQLEYEQLTSLRGRCTNQFRALFTRGFRGWRVQRDCNQAASELAFARQRAARGFTVEASRFEDCQTIFAEFLRQTQ